MKVVTVATKSDKYFESLVDSCKRFNYELVVLGWNQKWGGFTWRFDLFQEYLYTLPEEEIVCFIDAYDVIMLRDSKIMEERFKKSGKRVIFAWDNCQDPILEQKNVEIFGSCKGKRINAGTYIGYSKDILRMIQESCKMYDCKDRYANDQKNLNKYCSKVDYIHADTDREIFLIINEGYDTKILPGKFGITFDKDNKLVFKNKYTPCVLHAPGQTNINAIVKQMGLKGGDVEFSSRIYWEYVVLAYLPDILKRYAMYILVFICAVTYIIYITRKNR